MKQLMHNFLILVVSDESLGAKNMPMKVTNWTTLTKDRKPSVVARTEQTPSE